VGDDADVLAALRDGLPDGALVTDSGVVDGYRRDRADTVVPGWPLALVRARGADDVQHVMRVATRFRVPVVPRGAGSGLSGGAAAAAGCILLSLDAMRAVEVDPAAMLAVVEPGVLNADLKRAAAEHGLWYPPDPSSFEFCSIGGNLATNAGGLCCVKYGVTTDYVLGMDVVLADGTLVHLGGKRIKDVAGLSLLKLFVGSEGTLGVITRAILRLMPAQGARATLVATFPTLDAAAQAVVDVRRTLRPSLLELMDGASINAVEDFKPMGLDRSAGAMLLAQSDAPGVARTQEIEAMEVGCRGAGADQVFVTDDPDEAEMFIEARRLAFPAIETRGALFLEDVGAPVPQLPDLLKAIAAIAARHDVEIPVVAHAGDGNTHPIVVYDAADSDGERRARSAFEEVMGVAIDLGGTITGEHGVGLLKKAALPDQLGPEVMALSRRIKAALDPDGILNPGAVL
jgi:glycolate oxidase